MKFENKPKDINMKTYKEICTLLWGSIPVDVSWAISTNKYKDACLSYEKELDKQYRNTSKN